MFQNILNPLILIKLLIIHGNNEKDVSCYSNFHRLLLRYNDIGKLYSEIQRVFLNLGSAAIIYIFQKALLVFASYHNYSAMVKRKTGTAKSHHFLKFGFLAMDTSFRNLITLIFYYSALCNQAEEGLKYYVSISNLTFKRFYSHIGFIIYNYIKYYETRGSVQSNKATTSVVRILYCTVRISLTLALTSHKRQQTSRLQRPLLELNQPVITYLSIEPRKFFEYYHLLANSCDPISPFDRSPSLRYTC